MNNVTKYYKISNALPENEHTGNVCVNLNDVLRYDKDFIFLYEGKEYIVTKDWVKNNINTINFMKEREDGTKYRCMIYVLKVQDILENSK